MNRIFGDSNSPNDANVSRGLASMLRLNRPGRTPRGPRWRAAEEIVTDEGGATVDARNGGCYGLRPMTMTPAEWLAAYRAAWLQRDADAAAALFTEDATYAEQPYQDAFAGPAAVRAYWARVTATQSNIEMRYGTPISVGNRTAVEWWTTLVNDGAPITLAGAFILTFDASGRCRSLREYWQFTAGTYEPKPGWGS